MALPIFAVTLFVSAFLLFLVQPIIGKLILPKLGGTPQVWNTCMVFFQSVLLLGYAYTHTVSTKLKLRQQLMLHGAVLAIPLLLFWMFPFYETTRGWTPPAGTNPIVDTLLLLAKVIGIPFLVISTSAPLLQRWFAYSGHPTAKDPYFLYGASNLGSLLSLLFYPVLIEPYTMLYTQSVIFYVGYAALVAVVLYCAYTIYTVAPPDDVLAAQAASSLAPPPPAEVPEGVAHPDAAATPAPAPAVASSTAVKTGPAPGGPSAHGISRKKGMKVAGKPQVADHKPAPSIAAPNIMSGANAEMTWWRRIRWVLLAAVPSSLMLGVTSYISVDLSPFPLIWVIPLALYLLSFILVYMKMWTEKPIVTFSGGAYTLHDVMLFVAQPFGIIILCFIVMRGGFDPVGAVALVITGFFASALACHGELAKDRPATRYLTEYFLCMSFGGMLGGMFNGIIAPVVFQHGVIEFHIAIIVACMIRPQYIPSGWFDELILNAFPQFKNWVVNQGDEMAKSMGRPTPRTTYMFSYFLDILFGVFILSISYWLRLKYRDSEWVLSVLRFLSLGENWYAFMLNALTMGPPLVFIFFFAGRPVRMSLATVGLMMGALYYADTNNQLLESRRTYFGLLRVLKGAERPRDPEERAFFILKDQMDGDKIVGPWFEYTYLMHGTTDHGRCYKYDTADKPFIRDISRLATTYYHRYGPVGIVMEQYNWFPGKQATFDADARLPAALFGDLAASIGTGSLPLTAITECQTEPPYATIGLGTGTMASYARPFQHMTYYEIDEVIRGFSIPEEGSGSPAYFTYVEQAIKRGANMEIIMGDARLSLDDTRRALDEDREPKNVENSFNFYGNFGFAAKAWPKLPTAFKDLTNTRAELRKMPERGKSVIRENYYKVINVDAFSSDAIPIHLVTKEAIALYLRVLSDDGVLCVHTSNRHMDLVRPVARIAQVLSEESVKKGGPVIRCIVGKDLDRRRARRGEASFEPMGHTSSEYVMIFREREKDFDYFRTELEKTKTQLLEAGKMRADGGAPEGHQILNSVVEWYNPYLKHNPPVGPRSPMWTDDYSNILGVIR